MRKRKGDEEEEDEGEVYGTLIPQKKSQLIPVIDKSEFKYFKPWLQEPNKPLPQWAEELQNDKSIKDILTVMSNEDKQGIDNLMKLLKQNDYVTKKQIEMGATDLNSDDLFDPA